MGRWDSESNNLQAGSEWEAVGGGAAGEASLFAFPLFEDL